MNNPIKEFYNWTVNDGAAHMAALKKWGDIAVAVDPTYKKRMMNLVSIVDTMYTNDDLSSGQKAEWDTEKTGVEAAITAVCSFRG